MKTYTTKDLKNQLRAGEYTFPGCYPLFFITSDSDVLSFKAVRDNFRNVIYSMRHKANDGWRVVACDVNWEDPDLYCAQTGRRIESAYAEN